MELSNEKLLEIVAYEAFLRRAAELDFPVMLKGSYITRQYFADPEDRIPNDLDWLYLNRLEDPVEIRSKLDEWMIQVTGVEKDDGVRYWNFRDYAFWRMVDYAMADDFPTVNTDVKCTVAGKDLKYLHVDVSFNLSIDIAPVPLLYKPFLGEPFIVPQTVPLPLQVSWKLHQSLVRLRFKDIFDLIHLVKHPSFTSDLLQVTFEALLKECSADEVDPTTLHYLLSGELDKLFPGNYFQREWTEWRHEPRYLETALVITDPDKLPPDLQRFMELFCEAMDTAGVKHYAREHIPQPKEPAPLPDWRPAAPAPLNKAAAQTPPKSIWAILRELFR